MDDVAVFGLKIDATQAKQAADQFERSLDRLSTEGKKTERVNDSLNSSMGRLKYGASQVETAISRLGKTIGFTLAGSATAAAFAFRSTVNRMDELSKAAQRASMNTEAFSKLAYAADLADVGMQDLQRSMGRLAKAQDDASRGTRQYARAFEVLGIAYKNTDGTLRDTQSVFADFADRFEEFQGSPEIVALGMTLFGESFQNLIPLLKDGSRGLKEAGDEAERFGVVVSTEAGRRAEAFNDNLTRLTKSVEGLKFELFSGLIPQLDAVITRFIAARREGLGFIDAVDIAIGVEGFRRLDDQILVTRNKIQQLQGYIDSGAGPGGGFVNVEGLRREIDAYNAQLDRLIRVQRRIAGSDPDTGSFGPLVSEPPIAKPRTLRVLPPSTGGGNADPLASVLDAAYQRDFERMQTLREQADEFEGFLAQLLADDEAKLRAQAEAWKNLLDPTRKYAQQLEEIRGLVASGKLTKDEGTAAEFEVESKRNDELLRGLTEQTEEASDAARELGLTFASAFEDAIVSGRSLSDVLAGIGQDLLRLTVRKSITEPAANWLSTALGSVFKFNADGNVYASRSLSAYSGNVYTSPQLFAFAKGAGVFAEAGPEAILPLKRGRDGKLGVSADGGGTTINITSTVNAAPGTDIATLSTYLDQRDRALEARFADGMRRGRYGDVTS